MKEFSLTEWAFISASIACVVTILLFVILPVIYKPTLETIAYSHCSEHMEDFGGNDNIKTVCGSIGFVPSCVTTIVDNYGGQIGNVYNGDFQCKAYSTDPGGFTKPGAIHEVVDGVLIE